MTTDNTYPDVSLIVLLNELVCRVGMQEATSHMLADMLTGMWSTEG